MTDEALASIASFGTHQLDGFRIGVTSDRRSEDLITAFERRGAQVVHAPTLNISHAEHDDSVIAETRAIIAASPDLLLATTGYGIRRWFEVADAAGLGDALTDSLGSTDILVRGPKARGSIRAVGLRDSGMSETETTASLVTKALHESQRHLTVVVQVHGHTDESQLNRLRAAHTVLTVAPYRWTRVSDQDDRVRRLVDAIASRQLDAVTFTSAPAVEALLVAAEALGVMQSVIVALQTDVIAAAVGPVTAAPLLAAGITPLQPERFRMGALIRLLCEHLVTQRTYRVATRHGDLVLRGQVAELRGRRISLPPTSVTLLRRLIVVPGAVLSRTELADALPGVQDDHAMEVALSRLRRSLGVPGLLTTVVKRGYRLDA